MPKTPSEKPAPKAKIKLPFWGTLLTALGLCILCGLGTWQLQRLAWKNDLIVKIETAYSAKPAQPLNLTQNLPEYSYGKITGRFLPDKAFLLGPPQIKDEKPGYRLIVPLQTDTYTLLINMGWTPYTLDKQPIYHLQGKTITFHGLLKSPHWNAFTPDNSPQNDIWFRLNMPEVAAAKALQNLYPDYLLADQANYKFDAAFFGDQTQDRLMPNNNHLQYALFWFAMAAAMLTVYVLRFLKEK